MTDEQKTWIDGASYKSLLYRWRFGELGDVIFQDDTGDYYAAVMEEKRKGVSDVEHTQASKSIGWEAS